MFDKQVSTLLKGNAFVQEALRVSNETVSGNGSLKYITSEDEFVDNFCSISNFKEPRSYNEIAQDMQLLWSIDPLTCLKLAVYIRAITRKTTVDSNIKESIKGQGLKHEGIFRFIWIAINHPEVFEKNLGIFIAVGSWKDIITMLNLDLRYNGWENRKLNWELLGNAILYGLTLESQTHLIRKYLPTIRTNQNCKTLEAQADTIIGRWLARKIFPYSDKIQAYRQYRKLKSGGLAHQWQQQISRQLYDNIKFNTIAGRALQLLVNSKFLENHNLREKYTEWIKSQPTAKFTGFVFELFKPLDAHYNWQWQDYSYDTIDEATRLTINAQFATLIGQSKVKTTFLVARDISGSMLSEAKGCKMSSYSVAKAMALYFSEFLTGPFANSYVEFATECRMKQWVGKTPVDKWLNDTNGDFGTTDFLSVAHLLVEIRRRGVPESEFPNGLLALSDGDFDRGSANITNFQEFRQILRNGGFSDEFAKDFKLVLWDIPNTFYRQSNSNLFEDFADAPNSYHIAGYDASIVSFLMGEGYNPCNSKELFEAVMNQPLLNMLKL